MVSLLLLFSLVSTILAAQDPEPEAGEEDHRLTEVSGYGLSKQGKLQTNIPQKWPYNMLSLTSNSITNVKDFGNAKARSDYVTIVTFDI